MIMDNERQVIKAALSFSENTGKPEDDREKGYYIGYQVSRIKQ